MSDTLIMLSKTGDRLCADVIEPDHTPYRLFYSNFEELNDVLVEAHEHGLSGEACRHVIDIALAAACANETPREPWKGMAALPRHFDFSSPWLVWLAFVGAALVWVVWRAVS